MVPFIVFIFFSAGTGTTAADAAARFDLDAAAKERLCTPNKNAVHRGKVMLRKITEEIEMLRAQLAGGFSVSSTGPAVLPATVELAEELEAQREQLKTTAVSMCEVPHFIHIGKCGGTMLEEWLVKNRILKHTYHVGLTREVRPNPDVFAYVQKIIVWVRDPITRFRSAYDYQRAITSTDVSGWKSKNQTRCNLGPDCLDPHRLKLKYRTGVAFTKEFDRLNLLFTDVRAACVCMGAATRARTVVACMHSCFW